MNARREFRRSDWLSLVGGLVVMAIILLTGLVGRQIIERERTNEIRAATEQLLASVAETVASDVGRALGYGIPLDDIYGAEPYLEAVAAANSEVAGIALTDPQGRVLAVGGALPTGAAGIERQVEVNGQVLAVIKVAATNSFTRQAARDRLLILLASAAIAGMLAALLLRLMLLEGTDLPLARLQSSLRSIGRGQFGDYTAYERRGPVLLLAASATRVIIPIRHGYRQLLAAAREITAVDLDHSAQPRLQGAMDLISTTYTFAGGDRSRRVHAWAGWWLVAALLLGEAVRPLVGGFAADRAPGTSAEPMRVALVFLAQSAAGAVGLVLAWRLRGGPVLAGFALALCGLATLSVEWLYSGGLFLASRAGAALMLTLGAGTLALSGGVRLRRPWLGLATLIAVAGCGPSLGSLLGELLGRRLAYATLGGGLLLLGICLALTQRSGHRGPWSGHAVGRRSVLALGAAALVVNGWLFGQLAAFPLRYDYALMALLLATLAAAAALAALPRWGLPNALAVLLAAAGPGIGLLEHSLWSMILAAAIAGIGLGFLWRGARIATPAAALALLAGQGIGPVLAALEHWTELPPGAVTAGTGLLLALLLLLPAGRR